MRLAEVTRDVAEQLNDVSERYQVPQRLHHAGDTARRGAEHAYRHAYRGAQNAYQLALENPRASAAVGVVVGAHNVRSAGHAGGFGACRAFTGCGGRDALGRHRDLIERMRRCLLSNGNGTNGTEHSGADSRGRGRSHATRDE